MHRRILSAAATAGLILAGGAVMALPALADEDTAPVCYADPTTETTYDVAYYEATDWVTEAPDDRAWVQIAQRTVTDVPEVPGGYEATGWVLQAPDDGRDWVQIAERWVGTPAQPAQGEPTMPNPDYVPATTVEHEAEYATQWKYVRNGGPGEVWLDNDDAHKVKIDGEWYQRTSKTRQVLVKAAWSEPIPAQGEPTMPNPDYVPAQEAVGHAEYRYAWHQAHEEAQEHEEYKYALYLTQDGVEQVPDGWTIKATHEVEVPGQVIDCPPVDEPTEPTEPEPTNPDPTTDPEPTTPVTPAPPVVTPAPPAAAPAPVTPAARVAAPAPIQAQEAQEEANAETLAYTGTGDATGALAAAGAVAVGLGALALVARRRITSK